LGIPTPETKLLTSIKDLEALLPKLETLVLKPAWSRFAKYTRIKPNREQLADVKPNKDQPWVAQQFIEGQEICVYSVIKDGELKALSSYYPRYRAGTGAGVYLEPTKNSKIEKIVRSYASGTNWTGQLSFDCIKNNEGLIQIIECNPRSTSGLHFFNNGIEFYSSLCNETQGLLEASDTEAQTVALAMLYYGLPTALKNKMLPTFIKDYRRAENLFSWPNDPLSVRRQLKSVLEFAVIAVRKRISLQAASTYDTEWNGTMDHLRT